MAQEKIVRVKVLRGFYANRQGSYGVCNPGDVIDLDRNTAVMMVASGKAEESKEEMKHDPHWQPDRIKNPPQDPVQSQIAALTQAVAALGELVKTLAAPAAPADEDGKKKRA